MEAEEEAAGDEEIPENAQVILCILSSSPSIEHKYIDSEQGGQKQKPTLEPVSTVVLYCNLQPRIYVSDLS